MPKQAIVQPSLNGVQILDTPIPTPKEKEVVIKVAVAGSNPKDWKYPTWKNWPHNSGDDIAGIIHSVGSDIYEFRPGDRVAALHQFLTENGAFAEYAVAPDWTTFHLPTHLSFEEAATIPVAAMTAAMGLFADMQLPAPYSGVQQQQQQQPASGNSDSKGQQNPKIPLLIYGASTAVGAFAAQFARLAGISPIIGVAGRAADFARDLVDYVVDYRDGVDTNVAAIKAILAEEGLAKRSPYVFDAISEGASLETVRQLMADYGSGTVSTVLPPRLFATDGVHFAWPDGVRAWNSASPFVHTTHKDFGYVWSRYLGRLLQESRLRPHPHEVVPGGLNGVITGLQKLRDGQASAVKYVYRIADTADDVSGAAPLPRSSGYFPPGKSTHRLRNFPFPVDEEVSA